MEKKFAISRNLLVIVAVIVLIAVVAVIASTQKRELNPTLGALEPDATATPVTGETAEGAVREATEAYLVITVAGEMYEPIPLEESARYSITRGENVNVVEVTQDSVWMASSTCDNQDCVEQGTVSLENRDGRVLKNMVICMPNDVTLELYTAEEITALLLDMAGYTGEEGNE